MQAELFPLGIFAGVQAQAHELSFAATVLMGPALSPWLDRLRGWRWGSLFFMIDDNWPLAITDMGSGGRFFSTGTSW